MAPGAGAERDGLIRQVRALLADGRSADAEETLLSASRLRADVADLLESLADYHLERQDTHAAARVLTRCIEAAPTRSGAYFRLAEILERADRLADVIALYSKLCAERPELAIAHFNRAVFLRRVGRLDEAVDAYRRAIALDIDGAAEAWSNLGALFAELDRHAEARAAFARALQIDSRWTPALYNLGLLHEEFGERDAALALFERTLAIDPDHHDALARIVHADTMRRQDDPLIARLRARLGRDDLAPAARETLWFALGKALDDCGCYEDAFAAFVAGNAIARSRAEPYDRAANDRANLVLRDCFGASWLSRAHSVSTSPLVFVCGMWRSGTTLVERMLGAHPELTAGGEISYFNARLEGVAASWPVLAADPQALHALGRGYLDVLERRFRGARCVVNKRPDTWRYLGLLHGLFPQARFIVVERDPLDTCLSIFCQQFGDALRYATDLDDIADYLRGCRALLRHWRALFPHRILTIQYENLVARPEQALKEACAFLELPWNANMLDFAAGGDRVRTASVWQVRQPLHSRSVGRWRHYAPHLRAIAETLKGEWVDGEQ